MPVRALGEPIADLVTEKPYAEQQAMLDYLGTIDFIGKNLEVFALVIIGLSLLPIARELLKGRDKRG